MHLSCRPFFPFFSVPWALDDVVREKERSRIRRGELELFVLYVQGLLFVVVCQEEVVPGGIFFLSLAQASFSASEADNTLCQNSIFGPKSLFWWCMNLEVIYGRSKLIWGHLRISEVILGYLRSFEVIWGQLGYFLVCEVNEDWRSMTVNWGHWGYLRSIITFKLQDVCLWSEAIYGHMRSLKLFEVKFNEWFKR